MQVKTLKNIQKNLSFQTGNVSLSLKSAVTLKSGAMTKSWTTKQCYIYTCI